MKPLRILAVFFMVVSLISITLAYAQNRQVISVDGETGTRFTLIDDSAFAFATCKGGDGTLDIIGEVPGNISLADDSVAQSLVRKGLDALKRSCPKFSIKDHTYLRMRLFKGSYTDRAREVVLVEWKMGPEWEHPSNRKVQKTYHNAEFQQSKEEAMVASGEIKSLPNGRFLFLSGTDQSTGTQFWIYSDDRSNRCRDWAAAHMLIIGEVPDRVSLLDDNVARSIVMRGAQIVRESCNYGTTSGVNVYLVSRGYKVIVDSYGQNRFESIRVSSTVWYGQLNEHHNFVLEAEQKRQRDEAQRAQYAAKESARQKSWNQFARQYGVQELVNESNLFTNPFQYQGKTIAATLRFERMMTANSAIFEGGQGMFVISNIPTGTYKSKRDKQDLIAVTVLGMTELKGIPLVNSMQVPNLKFVGVHFCQEWSCSDILSRN